MGKKDNHNQGEVIMKFKPLFVITSILFGSSVNAGWSSGGGELLRDTRNPWFLSNTDTVKYCVKVDQPNFSLSEQQILNKVARAFEYWKREFTFANRIDYTGFDSRLATQDFVLSDCDSADIKFQFGYLEEEQFEYLKNPKKFVGVAVRTSYDRVHLRGKGFIYVSPDRGPLKPDFQYMNEGIWSTFDGNLLKLAVIHELGHVFGISHDTSSLVMAEDFLQSVLGWFGHQGKSKHAESSMELNYFRSAAENQVSDLGFCVMPQPAQDVQMPVIASKSAALIAKRFFGIPTSVDNLMCVYFEFKGGKLRVYYGESSEGSSSSVDVTKLSLAGQMQLGNRLKGIVSLGSTISVYVNEAQKVIPAHMISSDQVYLAYKSSNYVYKGAYVAEGSGKRRPLAVTVTSDGIQSLTGVLDGQLYVDLPSGE